MQKKMLYLFLIFPLTSTMRVFSSEPQYSSSDFLTKIIRTQVEKRQKALEQQNNNSSKNTPLPQPPQEDPPKRPFNNNRHNNNQERKPLKIIPLKSKYKEVDRENLLKSVLISQMSEDTKKEFFFHNFLKDF